MAGTSKPVDVSTKQRRIAQLARQSPEMGFTSLAYYIDIDWLLEAYKRTRKDGAVGVDGQDGEDYAVNLMGNLQSLLDRAKSGTYQAPPVRRVQIKRRVRDGVLLRLIGKWLTRVSSRTDASRIRTRGRHKGVLSARSFRMSAAKGIWRHWLSRRKRG